MYRKTLRNKGSSLVCPMFLLVTSRSNSRTSFISQNMARHQRFTSEEVAWCNYCQNSFEFQQFYCQISSLSQLYFIRFITCYIRKMFGSHMHDLFLPDTGFYRKPKIEDKQLFFLCIEKTRLYKLGNFERSFSFDWVLTKIKCAVN